jgi:tRNA 5-methylaminomethyl-2-thiouridine biosynthesis bifunctional protein
MVSSKKLTEFLARSAQVILVDVITIERQESSWQVNTQDFDVVILAGSFDVLKFDMTKHLPLQRIRGQITQVKVGDAYNNLKTNLSYGGYSSVAIGGEAIIGSTFQHWIDNDALRPEDDEDNISKLKSIAPELVDGLIVTGGRASFRCAAKDRTPVIGKIEGFENLYISTAHGSHGILSSLMAAEFLSAKIFNEPQLLPISVENAVSPNRFKLQ